MIPMQTHASRNGHVEGYKKLIIPSTIVCLDIETAHASQEAIDNAVSMYKAPSNIKDGEKIEAAEERYAEKIKEKDALLDASPIACISARTDKTEEVFSAMDKKNHDKKRGFFIAPKSECEMLIDFRDWMDSVTDENTVLIGFNIMAFDLPRLRAAFVRHHIRLPQVLTPRILDAERQSVIDVMVMFLRGFTADKYGLKHISLREVERRLGLPEYKNKISGAEVPEMVKRGEFKEVLVYCSVDTGSTLAAYRIMTSSLPGMK